MDNKRNITKAFMAKIIAFVGFYLCDIFLARRLGADEYAEWVYFFSYTNIVLWISNFGISLTLRTEVAMCEDESARKYTINCGIILRIIISTVFLFLVLISSRTIALFSGWPDQYPELLLLIRAGCLLPLFMSLTDYWKEIFIGSRQMNALVGMALFEHIGYAMGCLICILFINSVKGALVGFYLGYVTASVAGIIITKTSFAGFAFSKGTFNTICKLFIKAIPYVAIYIMAFVILEMDTVMIGTFRVENKELANYSIAKKIIQKAISINEAFLYSVLPGFAIVKRENYHTSIKKFRKIRNFKYIYNKYCRNRNCFGSNSCNTIYLWQRIC